MLVLLRGLQLRVRAVRCGHVSPVDFKGGESARVPLAVSLPNRNYMNLLEQPVLFYVICLMQEAVHMQSPASVVLAWVYVGLRCLHTIIHLGHNHILHRLLAFGSSTLVLVALWVETGLRLAT